MKVKRSALYIRSEGPSESAIVEGLQWLSELGTNDANKRSPLLAVPLKSNLKGVISSVIGEKAVKALEKGNCLQLSSAVELSLLTQRDSVYSWRGPVLAVYPNKKLLDKIDDLPGVTDVLVIPWTLEEVQPWIDTWSAIELGTVPQEKISSIRLNPVAIVALESLTNRVNLSTGITHPSDRNAAIELFRILRNAGIPYDPQEVRAWLVSAGGWRSEGADDVEKVASDILAGKKLRGGKGGWSEIILEIWKEKAEKS